MQVKSKNARIICDRRENSRDFEKKDHRRLIFFCFFTIVALYSENFLRGD
jgi:hypothetical protein